MPLTARRSGLDAIINRIAARTCCVVHADSLRAAGISRMSVQHRVADGRMVRALPRTYFVGPQAADPTFDMRCMAGVLAAGDGAMVSGEANATLIGGWNRGDGAIDITSITNAYRGARSGYRFHRGMWVPEAITAHGAIPVMRALEACLDIARRCTPLQLVWIIRRFVYLGRLTVEDLVAFAEQQRGMPGIEILRTAIKLVHAGSAGTRSASEDRLHELLVRAGLEPDHVNVRGCMGIVQDEPDFVWERGRVNVELDGGHHFEQQQRELDEARDRMVEAFDWHVHRVASRRVWHEPYEVVAEIANVIGRARSRRA